MKAKKADFVASLQAGLNEGGGYRKTPLVVEDFDEEQQEMLSGLEVRSRTRWSACGEQARRRPRAGSAASHPPFPIRVAQSEASTNRVRIASKIVRDQHDEGMASPCETHTEKPPNVSFHAIRQGFFGSYQRGTSVK